MRTTAATAAVLLTACGGDPECSKKDRNGTYLLEAETVSGSCGAQDSTLVNLSSGEEPAGGGCTIHNEGWSDDECSLTRDFTCSFPADDLVVRYLAVTNQDDDEGALLDGTMSITARYISTGALICSGTYSVTMTRQ